MIKIGFCSNGGSHDIGNILTTHPAFYPKREDFPATGRSRRCPSFNDYVLSSFNIGIAYDMHFCVRKTSEGKYFVEYNHAGTTLPEEALANALNLDDVEDGVVQLVLHPFWMFISDDPDVVMTVQPAVGQTNPEPFRGQLNIYNWFRPSSYAFRVKIDEWVKISKDSPIFQVKFYHPTETHFVLGEVKKTQAIYDRERYSAVHSIVGGQTFAKWREIFKFAGKRRPPRVLEFIEDDK